MCGSLLWESALSDARTMIAVDVLTEHQSRNPVVSVVIPAFKRHDVLRKAVLSAINQSLQAEAFEVIVVDSSPDDDNAKMVAELALQAKCHLQCLRKIPEGPAASRNLGAFHSRGEFIAFMDSDCFASETWLEEGCRAFTSDEIGIVQGCTLPDPDQKCGIFTWYVRIEQETFIYECANILYRRKAFESVEGFSGEFIEHQEFILGGEDLDLAWKVKRKQWKSVFADRAIVFHEVQPIPIKRWIWIERNACFPMLARKFPEIRSFFFARYFLDVYQAALVLGIVGSVLAFWKLPFLLLWLPYILSRSAGQTKSLRGPLRVVRAGVYFLRDVSTFFILTRSSLAHRSLLL